MKRIIFNVLAAILALVITSCIDSDLRYDREIERAKMMMQGDVSAKEDVESHHEEKTYGKAYGSHI